MLGERTVKAALKTAEGRFTIENVEEPALPGAEPTHV
jgi:hypothetical protein